MPPWQVLQLAAPVTLPNGSVVESGRTVSADLRDDFRRGLCINAGLYCCPVLRCAALSLWKRVTKGKHLWLRNNFSTLLSQLVDSVMVVTVTFGAAFLAGDIAIAALYTRRQQLRVQGAVRFSRHAAFISRRSLVEAVPAAVSGRVRYSTVARCNSPDSLTRGTVTALR